MIVLDSSATVDFLAERDLGEWVGVQLIADPNLHAPHLVDVEVANAFRNLVARGEVSDSRARRALEDLADLNVARYPHYPFLERIWELRDNLPAADATYVALAESLGARLVTTDQRLARAPVAVTIVAP